MKKVVLIISVIFLCSTYSIAQKTISKEDFYRLVDYANCQYLMAFIENNDAGKPYMQQYEKTVKPELQKATLDDLNKVPDFEKIKRLFPKGSNDIALNLANKINERKDKYSQDLSNEDLVNLLKAKEWKNMDLIPTATQILNAVYKKYGMNKTISAQAIVQEQTIQTSSQVEDLQSKISELQQQNVELKNDSNISDLRKSLFALRLIVYVLTGLIVLIVLFFLYIIKKQFDISNKKSFTKQYVKNVVLGSREISEKFTSKEGGNVSMFEDKLNGLERKIGILQEQVNKIPNTPINTPEIPPIIIENSNPYVKFFRTKNGKILQDELPNESGADFKIFNINGNEAKFEYCGGIVNPDYFTEICNFENNPADVPNKTKIITTVPGIVKKDINTWVVEIPAKIKFI